MANPIACMGDMHTCPAHEGKKPHKGGPIIEGSSDVFIQGVKVAHVGHKARCEAGGLDTIKEGKPMVLINGQPAAIHGSKTAHGGEIIASDRGLLIG